MGTSTPRRYLLSEPGARCIRIVSGAISLAEGATRTWVTLTRTGSFTDHRYGRFEITPKMLADMVRNFEAGTYGREILQDVAHERDKGAAAKLLELMTDGTRVREQTLTLRTKLVVMDSARGGTHPAPLRDLRQCELRPPRHTNRRHAARPALTGTIAA